MAALDPTEQFEDRTPPAEPAFVVLRWPWYWRLVGGLLLVIAVLYGSFQLAYLGKVYPGVSAHGVYVGGLSRPQALSRVNERISNYEGQTLPVSYGETVLRIPVKSLGLQYDADRAVEQAYQYGRQGSWRQRLSEQIRALLGQPVNRAVYGYMDAQLMPYLLQISEDTDSRVTDAALTFGTAGADVTPAEAGRRVDLGLLVRRLEDRLAHTDATAIAAPVYQLKPTVETSVLEQVAAQADQYTAGPIIITYQDVTKQIDQSTIITWLKVHRPHPGKFLTTRDLNDLYPAAIKTSIELDRAAAAKYVAELAKKVDQTPQNAIITMTGDSLSVSQPSRDGATLDQPASVKAILEALERPAEDRAVALALKVVKPDVNETNLGDLGIKELIAEGQTFFPGSSADRLTNVRVGASRFNGVILKPDEVFSFGKLLGPVGPAQGYRPELVILANHEEKQYGGGLCQVSSTAFRAALQAGLPILERHNHSFAISYYTAPYGVPGVDATIFYPQVDFKFKNDTGHHILIQTIMQGTTLKFQYYGTKTKSGVIKPPVFISGTTDTTQPSHTVFYRDVLDLAGNVIKTDTFHTYYKSSKDFPIQQQFN